jgi:Macrocin-O-methyltransferase (TylF)
MNEPDLYIDLLKRVLANRQSPGIGPRIRYLIDCIDPRLVRATKLENSPRDDDGNIVFDRHYFRDLEEHEPEAINGVRTRPGGAYWWEHNLGFPFTMISPERLDNVEFAVRTVIADQIDGDFLEAGVWRGGVGILMRALLESLGEPDRLVLLADSYEGLPAPTNEHDLDLILDRNWMLPASLATVRGNFESFGLLDERVVFIEGLFEDTMPSLETGPLAILRLDGDYYSSTIEVLRPLYDRVSPGGFVIVDDYHLYEGCRRAVHDFLDSRDLTPELIHIDSDAVYWRA